ncbi:MAG: universal stress protein [Vicinamibacterales bacterium]
MSTDVKTVLVAVDFGEASARALTLGGALAGAFGASLRVLHAETLDAPPYFTQAQMEALESDAQETRARARDYLREFARRHTDAPFEPVVDNRYATDAILHASADADLVVMGTHGRRGPSRWWLGSVAERVLRECGVPLLVVHATGPALAPASAFASGIVVAREDGAAYDTRRLAERIAHGFGGHLVEGTVADPAEARRRTGATWAAVPMPTPRTSHWLSHVGEPLVTGCAMPVLFVPEAQGGPAQ